jgi:hypothetical protein
MTRFGIVFWLLLVVAAGFATFKAKYAIQDLEDQLGKVRKQTIAEQSEIRVLNAEWTYLNQPERLAELNQRFLFLVPITAKQLQQRVTDIPLRPPAHQALPPIPEPVAPVPPALEPIAPALVADATPPKPPHLMHRLPASVVPVATHAIPARHVAPAATIATNKPMPPVQLARATRPASLDALIAQIAEVR